MRRTAIGLGAALALTSALVVPGSSSRARTPHSSARPPLVLVIFDALAPTELQTADRRIDPVRYPNFAAFAATSTWYRNATTIHESTRFSIPAILDARIPHPGQREDWIAHPHSIFTALHARYAINDREDATEICPPSLCPSRAKGSVLQRLAFGRVGRFRATVRRIGTGRQPQLTVLHTLITHEPRQYLPDGRSYQLGGSLDSALDGPASYNHRFLTEQSEQRTLLQLQYADRLLGELVAHMKRTGVWDRSAVALVSDHGESFAVKRTPAPPFQLGKLTFRRAVTPANIDRIAGVTMLVKYPRQTQGRVDTRFVRTIDLTPTLLQLARAPRGKGLAGRSLLDPRYRGQKRIVVRKQEGGAVTIAPREWQRRVRKVLAQRLAMFGSGSDSLFAFGPRKDLDGRAVSGFKLLPRSRLRASVISGGRFAKVHGGFVPAQVIGRLHGARPGGRVLAFALNGTVVATAPSSPPLGRLRFNFSAMLPPDAFRRGRNQLAIFEVSRAGLRPLDAAARTGARGPARLSASSSTFSRSVAFSNPANDSWIVATISRTPSRPAGESPNR